MYSFYHFISVSYGLFNQFRQIISFSECVIKVRIFLGHQEGFPRFSGFRIVTDCVAALPSSILALSDIAFPVRSSFWHKIGLLCNGTQYRKRQRKAMGKPHYYQKVINSQPPLIFVYGVARFELLRRLPPTTTV